VVQFPKGFFLGVGDGTFRINGAALSATLDLTRKPQFSMRNQSTGAYTSAQVGLATPKPTTASGAVSAITLSAFIFNTTISGATNDTPIVITVGGAGHGLYTGEQVTITAVTGNTNANGTWTITNKTATTFSLDGSAGNAGYGAGGVVTGAVAQRPGDYNVVVVAKNTLTLGYSNPTPIIAPITIGANEKIKVTFNSAMTDDQDAYDIYCTEFADDTTAEIEHKYNGPWYLARTATDLQLVNDTYTTGRVAGTSYVFSIPDYELLQSQILSYNNFEPVAAEYIDIINGIPIYFSCQGPGNSSSKKGTSPGPVAIPSKPSNPEAVFLDKAITTAGADTIVGEFSAKSRIYALCQNTLQTLLLTTLEEEPIAFRALWNVGFRNPYNVAFIKEYLYGESTSGIVRSVAGGDDSAMEFEFASDIQNVVTGEPCGHKLVAYDPKNKAMCFFYTAAERRSGYLVTIVRPFLIDRGIWSTPIVLKKSGTDFVVSAVSTIGSELIFLAGGRESGGTISMKTYVFDGGDIESKAWYLAWNWSDDEFDFHPKTIKGATYTGRAEVGKNITLRVYGLKEEVDYNSFSITDLEAGTNSQASYNLGDTNGTVARKHVRRGDWGPFELYALRLSGSYSEGAPPRIDELVVLVEVNAPVR
jgi:hypothetical protein